MHTTHSINSNISSPDYVHPPLPSLNGGLYTGEPFQKGAPWANVPATPDAGYLIHYALSSANPPPGDAFQYPAAIRPGNSHTTMYGVQRVSGPYPIYCIKNQQQPDLSTCSSRFSKYSYI